MPGILRCDRINLNAPGVVNGLLEALSAAATDPTCWRALEVAGRYYFRTPNGHCPSEAGWYIVCDESRNALYVGKAENLDIRLNSQNGSRDNFANPKRSQDPVRNFLKAFRSSGVLTSLQVLIITERSTCGRLGVSSPLSELDRRNVEKMTGLFRERVVGTGRIDHSLSFGASSMS